MTGLVVLEAIVILLLGLLVVGLLRSHAEILRRLERLDPAGGQGGMTTPVDLRPAARPAPTGAPAVDVTGARPNGAAAVVGVAGAAHPTLLAFLTSGCATCGGIWEALRAGGAADLPDGDVRLVVVTKGAEAESPAEVGRLAPRDVTTVMSSAAWRDYGVPVSPYFVLVDGPSGRVVGEGAAATWEQMVGLLRRVVADTGWTGAPQPRRPANGTAHGRVEAKVDADLLRAGITPGHPSLYPAPPDDPPPPV